MDLLTAIHHQADACAELGSPMYAELLTRVAADIGSGGVCADALRGHEDDPGPSAIALRLLGSVHRLVLDGSAPALARFYPNVGGRWLADAGWAAFAQTVRGHLGAVRARLDTAPQTNEVGRAAALMGGLKHVVSEHRLPVRLREIGASGGLNLRADHFCYLDQDGNRHGRADSAVRLDGAWCGSRVPEADVLVVDRLGSDVSPADISSAEGRRTLQCYVWPDQTPRWQRLQNALRVAAEVPAEVRRQDARGFVTDLDLVDGATTVLWHSVMWQYLTEADQRAVGARLEQLGAQATPRRPFAHLSLEPARRAPLAQHEFLVALRTWPGGGRRLLGRSAPHGLPTVWA